MATATQVLKLAAAEIGYNVHTDPLTGSKYGRWYAKKMGSSYFGTNGVPFCAMFVSYILNAASTTCAGIPGASCTAILRAAKSAGKTVSKSSAKPGDLLIFDWNGDGPDHIGFCEINKGSYYQTIEGNTNGGRVARCTRSYSTVIGVIRPNYTSTTTTTTTTTTKTTKLDVDGYLGSLSVKAAQKVLGLSQTGVVSGQYKGNAKCLERLISITWENTGNSPLIKAVQKKLGITADGYIGPNTVKAIQKKLGITADGYLGPITAKEIQKWINKKL